MYPTISTIGWLYFTETFFTSALSKMLINYLHVHPSTWIKQVTGTIHLPLINVNRCTGYRTSISEDLCLCSWTDLTTRKNNRTVAQSHSRVLISLNSAGDVWKINRGNSMKHSQPPKQTWLFKIKLLKIGDIALEEPNTYNCFQI